MGRTAAEEIPQLLDYDRQVRWFSACNGRLGVVAGRTIHLQYGQPVAEDEKSCAQPEVCGVNEHAQEAIIVEGVAEIADVKTRRKFLASSERKYKFDMSSMKGDILSMKEPVFAV